MNVNLDQQLADLRYKLENLERKVIPELNEKIYQQSKEINVLKELVSRK